MWNRPWYDERNMRRVGFLLAPATLTLLVFLLSSQPEPTPGQTDRVLLSHAPDPSSPTVRETELPLECERKAYWGIGRLAQGQAFLPGLIMQTVPAVPSLSNPVPAPPLMADSTDESFGQLAGLASANPP